MSSAISSIDSRACASQVSTGPPRKKLCAPARGPPFASIAYNAVRKPVRSAANVGIFAIRATVAWSPSIHR
jgi:hypothetical protein